MSSENITTSPDILFAQKASAVVKSAGMDPRAIDLEKFRQIAHVVFCRAFQAIYKGSPEGYVDQPENQDDYVLNAQLVIDKLKTITGNSILEEISGQDVCFGSHRAIGILVGVLFSEGHRLWQESVQSSKQGKVFEGRQSHSSQSHTLMVDDETGDNEREMANKKKYKKKARPKSAQRILKAQMHQGNAPIMSPVREMGNDDEVVVEDDPALAERELAKLKERIRYLEGKLKRDIVEKHLNPSNSSKRKSSKPLEDEGGFFDEKDYIEEYCNDGDDRMIYRPKSAGSRNFRPSSAPIVRRGPGAPSSRASRVGSAHNIRNGRILSEEHIENKKKGVKDDPGGANTGGTKKKEAWGSSMHHTYDLKSGRRIQLSQAEYEAIERKKMDALLGKQNVNIEDVLEDNKPHQEKLKRPASPITSTRPEWPGKSTERATVGWVKKMRSLRVPSDTSVPPKPRSFTAYSRLEGRDMVFTIEHCFNCQHHNVSLRHDQNEYIRNADNFLKVLAQIAHNCFVNARVGVVRFQANVTPKSQHTDKDSRIGAFEIQVAYRPKDGQPIVSELLHSKLVTRRWPSKSVVEKRLRSFILKRVKTFSLTVDGENQLGTYEGQSSDGLVPYPVGLGEWAETALANPSWTFPTSASTSGASGNDQEGRKGLTRVQWVFDSRSVETQECTSPSFDGQDDAGLDETDEQSSVTIKKGALVRLKSDFLENGGYGWNLGRVEEGRVGILDRYDQETDSYFVYSRGMVIYFHPDWIEMVPNNVEIPLSVLAMIPSPENLSTPNISTVLSNFDIIQVNNDDDWICEGNKRFDVGCHQGCTSPNQTKGWIHYKCRYTANDPLMVDFCQGCIAALVFKSALPRALSLIELDATPSSNTNIEVEASVQQSSMVAEDMLPSIATGKNVDLDNVDSSDFQEKQAVLSAPVEVANLNMPSTSIIDNEDLLDAMLADEFGFESDTQNGAIIDSPSRSIGGVDSLNMGESKRISFNERITAVPFSPIAEENEDESCDFEKVSSTNENGKMIDEDTYQLHQVGETFGIEQMIRDAQLRNQEVLPSDSVTSMMSNDSKGIIEEKKDVKDNAPEPSDTKNICKEMTHGDDVNEADGVVFDGSNQSQEAEKTTLFDYNKFLGDDDDDDDDDDDERKLTPKESSETHSKKSEETAGPNVQSQDIVEGDVLNKSDGTDDGYEGDYGDDFETENVAGDRHDRNPAKGNDNIVFEDDEEVTQPPKSSLTVADMGADMGGEDNESDDDSFKYGHLDNEAAADDMKTALGSVRNEDAEAVLQLFSTIADFTYEINWSLDVSLSEWTNVKFSEVGAQEFWKIEELILTNIPLMCGLSSAIGIISNLKALDLTGNSLCGSLPLEISQLQYLCHLDLHDNKFNGKIPNQYSTLTQLKYLDLSSNQLTDKLPKQISTLTSLEKLFLQNNRLVGPLPRELADLPNLHDLLCDLIPYKAYCTKMASWIKAQTRFYVDIPRSTLASNDEKEALTALYNLADHSDAKGIDEEGWSKWLSEAPLWEWEGVGVDRLGRVQSLVLRDRNLNGNIPPEIEALEQLLYLDLSKNNLTGPLPTELGSLTAIQHLHLDENNLQSDALEDTITTMMKLVSLDLSSNRLTGFIPNSLSGLVALKEICLQKNKLDGPLPPELSALPDLRVLDLSQNQLTGQIPEEYANMEVLSTLNLSGNQLTGKISENFGQLTGLHKLILRDLNSLSGGLPSSFSTLLGLQHVDVRNSSLFGDPAEAREVIQRMLPSLVTLLT